MTRRATRTAVTAGLLIAALASPAGGLAAPVGGASTSSPSWTFVSAPNLHPPKLQVLTRNASVAQGDFLAATQAPRRVGKPAGGQGGR